MKKWNYFTAKELKPEDWLRQQLEIQARGLSGNLHKVWPDIRDSAWIGGNREGWERVPYWLDGFVPLAYLLEDEDLIAVAVRYIDAIIARQEPDGWLCPCKPAKRAHYDTWALQLITKTLTVYYECSGDERIPAVLYKALKNYYELLKNGSVKLFGWGKFRWFETFIALNFLQEKYHEPWIKELAVLLFKQGYDYRKAMELWKQPKRMWRFKTHIVNLAMMLKAEAVCCDLLGREYTDRAETFRTVLATFNGTAFEGFTGDECLAGISPVRGTELCSVVEQMYSYELLYAYTGDAKWAERMEMLAFNALPATLSEDMWTHQYDQMVNQIACQRTVLTPFGTNGPRAHLFGLEPQFGCCTANFSQGFPKLALAAFLHKDNTIISAIMLPCRLQTDSVTIEVQTNYPFENKARYIIHSGKDFDFILRVPSFAENVLLNGEAAESGELVVPVKQGDTVIELVFETPIQLKERPRQLYCVQRGSLLFSLPIAHKKKRIEYERRGVKRNYPYCDYELIPTGKWNYAFCNGDFDVTYCGVNDVPFSESHPPVTVTAKMRQISWGYKPLFQTVCAAVPQSTKLIGGEETVTLIPYACAKLRMTELPIIEE